MKIGILTFHRALNYGAVLQCYGLYKTLLSMGNEVEIIDYRPEYVERHRQLLQSFNLRRSHGLSNILRTLLISLLEFRYRADAARRFDSFVQSQLTLTPKVTPETQLPSSYDAIIVGSDQVWSPKICYGFDPLYWGEFSNNNSRLISYAASIGNPNKLSESEWTTIGKLIPRFQHVSVRESQFKEQIERRFKVPVSCNLDPSLLLSREEYDSIADDCLLDDYVVAFSVVETKNFIPFAKIVSQRLHCSLVIVSAKGEPFIFRNDREVKRLYPTVGGFLGIIKKAKCVVTTSFHGTVFSIIYGIPFYSINHHSNTRVSDLLSSLGLMDRLVTLDEDLLCGFQYKGVDYTEPYQKLNELRENSLRYLNKSLS